MHQLIPQIRILDGAHLSSGESSAVDAQTLDEADDLICQGASRARAAWAEEEETAAVALVAAAAATAEVAGGDCRRPKGNREKDQQQQQQLQQRRQREQQDLDETFPVGLSGCSLGHQTTSSKVAMAAAVNVNAGGCRSPPPPHQESGGAMHWDSDLTQGGRQALSGNPRFVVFFGYAYKHRAVSPMVGWPFGIVYTLS